MAFEGFTRQLLARADEARDPGSGDAFLRLCVASEATLKLAALSLLSDAVYRFGNQAAKVYLARTLAGDNLGWAAVFEISGRLPPDHDLARRLHVPPACAQELQDILAEIDALLLRDTGFTGEKYPKAKSLAWRHALRVLVIIRNKVKGHGAPPARIYPPLNAHMRRLLDLVLADVVDPSPQALAYLRPTSQGHGLFLSMGAPMKEEELPLSIPTLQPGDLVLRGDGALVPMVPLAFFDDHARALWLFNDSANRVTGELAYIDYLQGQTTMRPGHFARRHGFAELTLSETSATPLLRTGPGVFIANNLPERRSAHVSRPELERDLVKYTLDDRRRILSLDGRGGVGKTYLAIEVCQDIARDAAAAKRFDAIVWVSGRDIDLTATGPKMVRQDVVTLEDILLFVVRACGEGGGAALPEGEALKRLFVDVCEAFRPLIIIDNFETYEEPEKIFREIDELVPNGAKVIITSRHRDYRGDFPITVGPMTEAESRQLIVREAHRRHVQAHFASEDRQLRVYQAARGHAYTMRLIVGQVTLGRTVHDACTDVEQDTEVMKALFERSLRLAAPSDVDLIAVLAALRVECPLEALWLLPIDRTEVTTAVGRLFNLSLLERIEQKVLREDQYACPTAAGMYVRKKFLDTPEARKRINGLAALLRSHTQTLRMLAKKLGPGPKSALQAADVMLQVARGAVDRKENDLARRAIDIATEFAPEDAMVCGEAARLSLRAGSAPEKVDELFGHALDLDAANAEDWIAWAQFKTGRRGEEAHVMRCYEQALEAEPESIVAALGLADAVLEIVAIERKLGAGAARENDKRQLKTLMGMARGVLEARAAKKGVDPATRERLLVAKGRVVLQQEGASEAMMGLLREIEKVGGKSAEARALVEAVKSARTQTKGAGET